MKAIRWLIINSTFVLALVGCAGAGDVHDSPSALARWEQVETDLGPGPARSLTDVVGSHAVWRDRLEGIAYHVISIDTLEGGRWTMFSVTFEEGPEGEIENASVLGCVGPSPAVFDYDGNASEVELTLETAADGARRGTIDARFPVIDGPDGVLSATFRIEAGE